MPAIRRPAPHVLPQLVQPAFHADPPTSAAQLLDPVLEGRQCLVGPANLRAPHRARGRGSLPRSAVNSRRSLVGLHPFVSTRARLSLARLLTSAPSRRALPRIALCARWWLLPIHRTRRAARRSAWALISRCGPSRVLPPSTRTARDADLPRQERELSMHKRRIYRRLRTGGLCCHVPARLASLGLVCGFCSSPRTSCTPASFGQSLAVLPLPSARGYLCSR